MTSAANFIFQCRVWILLMTKCEQATCTIYILLQNIESSLKVCLEKYYAFVAEGCHSAVSHGIILFGVSKCLIATERGLK